MATESCPIGTWTREKKRIDLGVMVLPRKCSYKCLSSLLDQWEDRDQFCVRLIVHLDCLPPLDGATAKHIDFWHDEFQGLVSISKRFDDSVIMGSTTNRGYGGSLFRILSEVQSPLFYADGDNWWRRSFRLMKVIESGVDYWSFNACRAGGTSPSVWSLKFVQHMLKWFPAHKHKVTEMALFHMASKAKWATFRQFDTKLSSRRTGRRKWPYANMGRSANSKFRFPRMGPARRYFDAGKNQMVCTGTTPEEQYDAANNP
tara:strand:- start:3079 stop:3855 length:777 start_codon:yes stop_codon:yes gene_type:complete